MEDLQKRFSKMNNSSFKIPTTLGKKIEKLLGQVKDPKTIRVVDEEMRKVHVHLLKELVTVEDPEDNSNPNVEIISTFYTIPEYEVIKTKISQNDTVLAELQELKKK